jgi:hypothetical protein
MPTWGAAMPMPLPNTWTASTRLMADDSWAMTRRASSASAGRSNGRAVSRRIGSPSWMIPSSRMDSLGDRASVWLAGGASNRHSRR